MDMILEKCPGTIGLVDDTIVFGKTKIEHDKKKWIGFISTVKNVQ